MHKHNTFMYASHSQGTYSCFSLASGTSFSDKCTCQPCMYKSSHDCPTGKVMIGRCKGNQIYDTSTCIDCNAKCMGASGDPQGKGQYIEREFLQSTMDYVCKPCLGQCPVGTYILSVCNDKGCTDTGCSKWKNFCAEGQPGVSGAH